MIIHFLRHATFIVQLNQVKILVDPMLSHREAMEPVQNAANSHRIPMVDLPLDDEALQYLLEQVDGVLVTHTHRDHWDARAVELLPKNLPILCQPEDQERISGAGFSVVQPVMSELVWKDVRFIRTGGRHGSGEIGQKMGPVSGFVLQARGEPGLYVAGDSIWCVEVESALSRYQPQVAVLNSGAAQFLSGGPITMTAEDVCQVCRAAPQTQVVAVHLETINHCLLTRNELRENLRQEGLLAQVVIPADGEVIEY